ncbi:hypothetical protein ADEAN_000354200 [Angomonas deanei]|uniref:FG-GAP repeat n=1 Tax=Angomonas deanei TaxID=59799 RepID=A0A7G2CAI5_9TRYP|nr:hypothetical protein ADEAN_000354200 [Angomonas deanei]
MIDTGLLTCVDPLRRRVRWRAQTIAEFDPPSGAVTDGETGNKTPDAPENEEDQKDQRGDAYPHLTPYRPFGDRHGDNPIFARYARSYDYVIAVGQRHASVVGVRDGKVHQSIELPCTPIAPLLIEDINNDGVMDVIVTCKTGLYVYAGDMNGGAPQSVAVLILLVFFLVGLLFLVREVTVITKVEEAVDETERAEAARLRDMERRAFKRATD